MAHGLMNYDWMLSTKVRPWHGIGTVVQDAPSSEEAIKIAKLDWTVEQHPVYANNQIIENYFCNIRTDNNLPLGIVKGRYQIVQNNEAFNFVDNIIENNLGIECKYETAGSLFNGKRIFLLVKLPSKTILDDQVENYMFFSNSHDGSSALTAGISNVRVVCNNTLNLATKNSKRIWTYKHTMNLESKAQQASEALGLAVQYLDTIEDSAMELYNKKINEDKFFRELYEKSTLAEKSKQEMVTRIFTIYKEKDDLQNFKGTGWGLYNAVADYISNTTPLRQTKTFEEKKLASFFDGHQLLQTAQGLLLAA